MSTGAGIPTMVGGPRLFGCVAMRPHGCCVVILWWCGCVCAGSFQLYVGIVCFQTSYSPKIPDAISCKFVVLQCLHRTILAHF